MDLFSLAAAGSPVCLERYHQGEPVVAKPAWKKSVRTWQGWVFLETCWLGKEEICRCGGFWTFAYQWKMSLFWLRKEFLVFFYINLHELWLFVSVSSSEPELELIHQTGLILANVFNLTAPELWAEAPWGTTENSEGHIRIVLFLRETAVMAICGTPGKLCSSR